MTNERIERPQPIDVQPIGLSAETLEWAKKVTSYEAN